MQQKCIITLKPYHGKSKNSINCLTKGIEEKYKMKEENVVSCQRQYVAIGLTEVKSRSDVILLTADAICGNKR